MIRQICIIHIKKISSIIFISNYERFEINTNDKILINLMIRIIVSFLKIEFKVNKVILKLWINRKNILYL